MKKFVVFYILFFVIIKLSAQNPQISDKIDKKEKNENSFTGNSDSESDELPLNKQKLRNLNRKKQALILFRKGVGAYEDGNFKLASIFFNDFKRLYPHHPEIAEITLYQAKFLLKQQKYEQAVQKLVEYYRQNHGEDGEKALFEAINLYIKMGNTEKVKILCNNLREINPDSRFLAIIHQKMEIDKILMKKEFQGIADKKKQDSEEVGKNDEKVIILD